MRTRVVFLVAGDQPDPEWTMYSGPMSGLPYRLPAPLGNALIAYTLGHEPTGDFLRSCIAGDFTTSVLRVCDEYEWALKMIALFIVNEIPARARGSYENVDAWCKRHESPPPAVAPPSDGAGPDPIPEHGPASGPRQ